jgi:hypothetical protein
VVAPFIAWINTLTINAWDADDLGTFVWDWAGRR